MTDIDDRTQTIHARLGGDATFAAIAARFYARMDGERRYARLRAMHPDDLEPTRASLTGFLIGWAGGPRDWFAANPGRCMMSMHTGMTIDPEVAGQWAECMEHAIRDVLPDPAPGVAPGFDAEARDIVADALTRTAHALGRAQQFR
ncbi:globin [Novosphingobium sp. 9]|uniref:globin domain-containing protein n=1 Tax=Novosphingobium sp. 9 TaxID=2025349 RepID=UPI0021B6718B|nr:globin [Novosphingobium sp. 9]